MTCRQRHINAIKMCDLIDPWEILGCDNRLMIVRHIKDRNIEQFLWACSQLNATKPMISQHWFTQWHRGDRQEAITWAIGGRDLCRYIRRYLAATCEDAPMNTFRRITNDRCAGYFAGDDGYHSFAQWTVYINWTINTLKPRLNDRPLALLKCVLLDENFRFSNGYPNNILTVHNYWHFVLEAHR